MASDHWMQGAVKHPGALRRTLGVKAGEKIPEAKLEKAEHSSDPTTRRRAALAATFRKANHNDGGFAHCAPGQKMAYQHPEGHAHGCG